MSLRTLLESAAPHESFAGLIGAGTILVAGCGTGLPALTLAQTLPDVAITAVDLSRISLAYAQAKAAKLNARNITFSVADILALGDLPQRFDFIECSGVLHHMHDPAAGLTVLRGLLNPGGALLISLYSERGRVAEAAAQGFVRERQFSDTLVGLRAARAEIMALPPEHPARGVIDTPDFFTRDGVHDLIFNLHESRITPAAMKRLLTSCGLRAIAVDAPPTFGGTDFKTRHPDAAAQADLDLWDAFEQQHSQVFAHMIKVWCRPIAD
jgi:SAM-dependent methyltransferase